MRVGYIVTGKPGAAGAANPVSTNLKNEHGQTQEQSILDLGCLREYRSSRRGGYLSLKRRARGMGQPCLSSSARHGQHHQNRHAGSKI